jgi:hypothetical protein
MAVDTIRFVDSIAASPTVRLDVNDGTVWRTTRLSAPPPRLRRAQSSNAMRDGVFVSSSQYDSRVVTLELALVHSSEDNAATEWQKLARELDRPDNFLMYQPVGASKPVFFRTFRSDVPAFEQFTGGAQAFKKPTVELLAQPFAVGLREDITTSATIAHDPAGTNPCSFLTPTILGDVAAEPLLWVVGPSAGSYVSANDQAGAALFFLQAEAATSLGANTSTQPNDATFSGAGNNFLRWAPGVGTQATAMRGTYASANVPRGRFHVFVRVKSSVSDTFQIQVAGLGTATAVSKSVTVAGSFKLIDLGVATVGVDSQTGLHSPLTGAISSTVTLNIGKTGIGALNFDVDYILLIPTNGGYANVAPTGTNLLLDSARDFAGDYSGTAGSAGVPGAYFGLSGSFARLAPGVANRVYLMRTSDSTAITTTLTLVAHYWPQYLFVRPSAS